MRGLPGLAAFHFEVIWKELVQALSCLWQGWKRVARAIGNFQARLLLSVFYFIVVTPFALGVKLFSDPLELRAKPNPSYWIPREPRESSLEVGRRQS